MKRRIWIIGGGLLQIPAVEIAHDLGMEVILSDRNPGCACAGLVEEFHEVDTRDWEKHLEQAKKVRNVDAVFAEGASVELTVAKLAKYYHVPGLDPVVALRIASKSLSHAHLEKVSPMLFGVARTYKDAYDTAINMGVPFIVKPDDSSGSKGNKKFLSAEAMTKTDFELAQAYSTTGVVVLEELWTSLGEQSVETLWKDGKGYFLNWVDRPFLDLEDYSIEIGHMNPSNLSPAFQKEAETLVMAAGRALGMTTGILKFDLMLTPKGFKILETTARLSGGFDSQFTSPLAHGVDYIRGAMLLAVEDKIYWEYFLPKYYRAAVALSAFPGAGTIKRIDGIPEAKKVSGVREVITRMKRGDTIETYTNCTQRPLFVIAVGGDRAHARFAANAGLKKIKFVMEEAE